MSKINISTGKTFAPIEYYKGTSFNYAGNWNVGIKYRNDENVIDFISNNGALYVCTKSHVSDNNSCPNFSTPNNFWTPVVYIDEQLVAEALFTFDNLVIVNNNGDLKVDKQLLKKTIKLIKTCKPYNIIYNEINGQSQNSYPILSCKLLNGLITFYFQDHYIICDSESLELFVNKNI